MAVTPSSVYRAFRLPIQVDWKPRISLAAWRRNTCHLRHLPKSRRYAGRAAAISARDFAKVLENKCQDFGTEDALLGPRKGVAICFESAIPIRPKASVGACTGASPVPGWMSYFRAANTRAAKRRWRARSLI